MTKRGEIGWEGCREPITERRVREVEGRLGIRFPPEYATTVLGCHGGCPGSAAFSYEDPDERIRISDTVGHFFTLREPLDHETKRRLAREPYAWSELGIDRSDSILDFVNDRPEGLEEGLVPFTDTGSGDLICFDYRRGAQGSNPPIVIWRHEFLDKRPVVPVAASFGQFLGGLEKYDPEELLKSLEAPSRERDPD